MNLAVIAYTKLSTDTRVLKEANAAFKAGYNVDFYTPFESKRYSNFNQFCSKTEQYKGSSKLLFILSYLKFFFFCTIFLTRQYFTKKYKIIHIHNMPNFLVFSCVIPKLLGTRLILDIHDLMPELFAVKFNMKLNKMLIKLLYFEEWLSIKFVDKVISTNSLHTKRHINNGLNKDAIVEIVNVADEHIFYKSNSRNFESEELVIAYPSTISNRLGIDILVDAIKILKDNNIDIQLKIYGDGEYHNELKRKILQLELENKIELSQGFVDIKYLSSEMDKAHLGIIPLPSNYSNDLAMPVKISEYFAKGLAVISSDLKLLRHYFSDTVVFFKAGDVLDLSKAIEKLYFDRKLLKEYSAKGFEYFRNNPWNFYEKKYSSLLSELTEKK